MNRVIVTTTINPPTEAVRLYDALPDWHLIVVGDLATPPDYRLARGTYMSPADQEAIDKELSALIGWNCIQRRNLGFVLAWQMGADIVATVDDDNIPYPTWGQQVWAGEQIDATVYATDLPAFDPVGATNYPHLWHRGYPLQLLPLRDYGRASRETVTVDVQADFWDGDPDIDAICRMQFAPECDFDAALFPIASTAISPFDSQNTFVTRRWLPEYFMFPFVGRMDDIWAAYHLQAQGARVVYGPPSVRQERPPRDPIIDLRREYLGYENNLALVESLPSSPSAVLDLLPENARAAFARYQRLLD